MGELRTVRCMFVVLVTGFASMLLAYHYYSPCLGGLTEGVDAVWQCVREQSGIPGRACTTKGSQRYLSDLVSCSRHGIFP